MGAKKYFFTIFGVTAVLTAVLGAGSASATVLCNESAAECTSYGKGAALNASVTEGTTTFSTTGGTLMDTCTFGMIEGTTNNAGGASETVGETIEELSWGSCTNTTDTTNKGELEFHWISGTSNATVTGKNVSVTFIAFGVSCTYGTGTARDLGTLTGGSPATIDVNTVLIKQAGGILCPPEAEWTASYTVPLPRPLYGGKSSTGTAPILSIKNVGAIPIKNTGECEFEIESQMCDFQVTNKSGFPVKVMSREVLGTTGRYRFVSTQCEEGSQISNGKSCTAEVEVTIKPEAGWINWFLLEVEETGSNGKNRVAILGLLKT